ncbi:MAG: hypothetical protein FWC85_04165 [Elusimicrobia bacterium]|nr:hypothetical protein [Elusimicrobiota bacterium]
MYNETAFVKNLIYILKKENILTNKIHIQKFSSFLTEQDENVPFRFSIYKFGPFSIELQSVLNTMQFWENLSYDMQSGYSIIEDSITEELPKKTINNIYEKIKKIKTVLPDYNFDTMELYGTMYYFMNRVTMHDKKNVFKKFKEEKNKFTDTQLDKAYASLKKLM